MTRRTDRFYKLFKHGSKHLMLNIRFIKFWLIIEHVFIYKNPEFIGQGWTVLTANLTLIL